MTLEQQQIDSFKQNGFITYPGLLSDEEVGVLETAMEAVIQREGEEVARESDGRPNIVYGIHHWDERFRALARHPKILKPAEALLDSKVFIHAARVNLKQTGGSYIDWHQDFGSYHFMDGMPEPRGLMIAVFLDDVTACNAPLLVIPGSHNYGAVKEVEQQDDPQGPCVFKVTPETVAEMVESHGVEAVMGPAGTVSFMQINMVHGSSVNITPLRRVLLYLILSAIDNRGETFQRPAWRATRDFTPLEPLGEDCLLAMINDDLK